MKRDEIIANVVLIVFFISMLYYAIQLHEIRRLGEIGSGFWPTLTLSAAALLSLLQLASTLKKYFGGGKSISSDAVSLKETKRELRRRRKNILLSVAILLGYIIIMPWIGFILSTLIFVFTFIIALGEKRRSVLILSPFLATALITIIFAKLIAMPFPRGIGIFASLSRLIY